jgi:3-methyl-2-oxobutanoate hydroxymethyltransferase
MARKTVPDIVKKKRDGKKITALTAYDYPFTRIVDAAGIDMILVGDSLGVVVQGGENTLSVTMDEMIYHTRIVSNASEEALVIGDMPFLSYQAGPEDAVRNAGRFIKEGGAQAVKLEGGYRMLSQIEAVIRADIPVLAHIGLTPQSLHKFGGYKIQGREATEQEALFTDAKILENAGVFGIVLEGIPMDLGRKITESLTIPTIGIGAGPHCDGQILVIHDLLGLFEEFTPTFVRKYADMGKTALDAVKEYKKDVETGRFPSEDESYSS